MTPLKATPLAEPELGFHDLQCLVIFIREIFAIATVQEHSATGTLPLGLQADLEYILFLPNLATLDGVI